MAMAAVQAKVAPEADCSNYERLPNIGFKIGNKAQDENVDCDDLNKKPTNILAGGKHVEKTCASRAFR